MNTYRKMLVTVGALALIAGSHLGVLADEKDDTEEPETVLAMWNGVDVAQTDLPATNPSQSLKARLIDPENKARKKAATVEAEVQGMDIVDPEDVGEQARQGQGHFHYQIDGGPIIATTSKKLSFHELSPGSHSIVVQVAGNDHMPTGLEDRLTVIIPQ